MSSFILFGGTFDPIHNGHVRIANYAALKLNADVILVPARSPRWKTPYSSVKHRLAMLKRVLKRSMPSGTSISTFEIDSKEEVNYSIDTVKHFVKKYPKDNFYLLIGADQVERFPQWKNAEELAQLCQIVFISRPTISLDSNIIATYKMIDLKFYDSGEVSSTDIRNMKSIDVPNEILEYLENEKLYFYEKVANLLPDKRYKHCLQVANLAYRIAKANKLPNPVKYYFAGLLHDLGKTYGSENETAVDIINKFYPEYIDLPKFSYHQFIGEYLAKNMFGIKDEDILNSIKYHCTGNSNMSDLAMVVYASDKIEPTRGFDSRFLINSCMRDYKQGFIDTLIDNKKYLLAHNKDITNRLTDACFEMYIS